MADRDVEEGTNKTLLQSHPEKIKVQRSYKKANTKPATRNISICLIVVTCLLIIIGTGAAGLAITTLRWTGSGNPPKVYTLEKDTDPVDNLPPAHEILEFPQTLQLLGLKLILAAGIASAANSLIVLLYTTIWGLRFPQIPKSPSPALVFRLTLSISILTAIYLLIALAYSWNEYYTIPTYQFANYNIVDRLFKAGPLTPETWAQQLSRAVVDGPARDELRARFIIANVARSVMAAVAGFQIAVVAGLCALSQRMKWGESTVRVVVGKGKGKGRALEVVHDDGGVELGDRGRKVPVVSEATGLVGEGGRPKPTAQKGWGWRFARNWSFNPYGNFAYTGPR